MRLVNPVDTVGVEGSRCAGAEGHQGWWSSACSAALSTGGQGDSLPVGAAGPGPAERPGSHSQPRARFILVLGDFGLEVFVIPTIMKIIMLKHIGHPVLAKTG